MSVSFTWKIHNPDKRNPTFRSGTSNDISVLDATFPDRLVGTNDIATLRAMARASGSDNSLWKEIADKLESLQGDTDRAVILKIDTEF